MSRHFLCPIIVLFGILHLSTGVGTAWAENDSVSAVRTALDELDQFVGSGDNGNKWRLFLRSDDLRRELSATSANRDALRAILAVYCGTENGLELAQFQRVKTSLQQWLAQPVAVSEGSNSDGPSKKIVLVSATAPEGAVSVASSGEPAASAAKKGVEAELLGFGRWADTGTDGKGWRAFIDEDKLRELLKSGSSDDASREFLEKVRDRLRRDDDGLESVAAARLETSLTKYLRAARGEVAKPAAGLPNFFVNSSSYVAGSGANQSIDRTEPIVDDILGTHIVGTGRTIGKTQMRFIPNTEKAVFDMVLTGTNYSNTTGYHDPVTIFSTGVTTLCGSKKSQMDANGLVGFPACAQADARTNVNSLCVNRKHFQRIIERAAWKRIGQNHAEAEAIASQHAQQRLQARMEKDGNERIAKSNSQYHNDFRAKLEARDAFPTMLDFATPTSDLLTVIAREASEDQMGAPDAPPVLTDGGSLSVRVHETMLNNFLAKRMGGREVTAKLPKKLPEQRANETDEQFRKRTEETERRIKAFAKKQERREKDKLQMQTIFITEKPASGAAPTSAQREPAGGEGTLKAEYEMKFIYHPTRPVEVKFQNDDVRVTFNLKDVIRSDASYGEWQIVALYHIKQDGDSLVLTLKDANTKENLDPTQDGQKALLRDSGGDEAKNKGEAKSDNDDPSSPDQEGKAKSHKYLLGVFAVPLNLPENLQKRGTRQSIRTSFSEELKPEYRLRYIALPGNWIHAGQMTFREIVCKNGWLGLALRENGQAVDQEIVAKREELKQSDPR